MDAGNQRPDYDPLLQQLADYLIMPLDPSPAALSRARLCLLDTLACGLLALNEPRCTRLLGQSWGSAPMASGVRVPGTPLRLDPVQGAWQIGCLNRWLDFNDTWLAAEWGHPSDNLAAILAVCDWQAQQPGGQGVRMERVLEAMIKAHEIQGVLALNNSFNRVGLDHVLLVKLASAGVSAWLLGAEREQLLATLSQVFVDGQALRTYRQAPNTGSRKSWAAGDASARGLQLACLSLRGEMGIPGALSAEGWGFEAVSFGGASIQLVQPLGCYVMEQVLFKIAYPAEFHAQTAVEAAIALHPEYQQHAAKLERIELKTQESALRIISKQGPLANPADRDHCLEYMVAVGLSEGALEAHHYSDQYAAAHPELDRLRSLMQVSEEPGFSRDYLDPDKRSIANSVQLFYCDGRRSKAVVIEYPLGHPRRQNEALAPLLAKAKGAFYSAYPPVQAEQLLALLQSDDLSAQPVVDVMAALARPETRWPPDF